MNSKCLKLWIYKLYSVTCADYYHVKRLSSMNKVQPLLACRMSAVLSMDWLCVCVLSMDMWCVLQPVSTNLWKRWRNHQVGKLIQDSMDGGKRWTNNFLPTFSSFFVIKKTNIYRCWLMLSLLIYLLLWWCHYHS